MIYFDGGKCNEKQDGYQSRRYYSCNSYDYVSCSYAFAVPLIQFFTHLEDNVKRKILAAIFAFLLAILFVAPSFALYVPSENIRLTDDGAFDVVFESAEAGKKYSLWVISGIYDSVDALDRDNTELVLYYAEATAEGTAVIFENIRPRSDGEFTAFVVGENDTWLVGNYSNKEDSPAEPDTPDTPATPNEPDEPDTPDTPDTPDEPKLPSGLTTEQIIIGAALGVVAVAIIVVIIVSLKKYIY